MTEKKSKKPNTSMLKNKQNKTKILNRETYLYLVDASLRTKQYKFALEASLNWLAAYPGDLKAGYLYSRGLIGKGLIHQAVPILEGLCLADPEFYAPLNILCELLASAQSNDPNEQQKSALAKSSPEKYYSWLYSLGSPDQKSNVKVATRRIGHIEEWGKYLRHAQLAAKSGDFDKSEKMIILAIGENPSTPIVQLAHLKLLNRNQSIPISARLNIARHYHTLWPTCLPITLLTANWMMEVGEHDQAVKLIHQVMSRDIGGQVPQRLWGINHSYRSLWPERIELELKLQIPAEVAVQLGANQIPARVMSRPVDRTTIGVDSDTLPEFLNSDISILDSDINNIGGENHRASRKNYRRRPNPKSSVQIKALQKARQDLERLAVSINQPGLTKLDGRYPNYILFTSQKNLEHKYGEKSSNKIIQEMKRLAEVIAERSSKDESFNWSARVFIADNPQSTGQLGLSPVKKYDPWSLKLALRDLDNALARHGEMIGALLIVGGPEIVPFHHLPNPVDDPDDYIESDNPYGTKDENYFMPDWPVGRFPDGKGTDPNLLIQNLKLTQRNHLKAEQPESWLSRLYTVIMANLKRNKSAGTASLGYSAEVWKNASQFVYRPIGDPRKLFTSPPLGLNGKKSADMNLPAISSANLGYFNLHGLIDSSEWYGQSDPGAMTNDPDYPVALRPGDIRGRGKDRFIDNYPEVVFSEACYGAHITGKSVEESLALTFLYGENTAFIGSTSMAYGSINPPLIAADYMGHSFWLHLKEGLVVGEALRQAKIKLAQEMDRRQGYLDGEDQKTLASFILYGDPLAHYLKPVVTNKTITRLTENSEIIETVCDRITDQSNGKNVPIEDYEYIKSVVAQYLPGMSDAQITCGSERSICHGEGHLCPTSQIKSNQPYRKTPGRRVFTLKKSFTKNSHQHRQYARVTVDENGDLVKFAVSR